MERTPFVSVIVLAYNHERYIAQALDSILAQEGPMQLELLIGEDCSTDGTREIVRSYEERYPGIVRMLTSEQNVGVWENYRRLLSAARGDFIAHLDGDDYWLPGKLAAQLKELAARPACAAAYTNAAVVDRTGTFAGVFNNAGTMMFSLAELLRGGNFLNNSSMLFRAKYVPQLLDIDRPFLDYRTHLRLARTGHLLHLSTPYTAYRIDTEGSMVRRDNSNVRRMYWEAIQDVPPELISEADAATGTADFLRRVAMRSIKTRDAGLLRNWWTEASAAAPCTKLELAVRVCIATAVSLVREGVGTLATAVGRPRVLYRR